MNSSPTRARQACDVCARLAERLDARNLCPPCADDLSHHSAGYAQAVRETLSDAVVKAAAWLEPTEVRQLVEDALSVPAGEPEPSPAHRDFAELLRSTAMRAASPDVARRLSNAARSLLDAAPHEWRDFTPVPRPEDMRKRADRACFMNAWCVSATVPSLSYAEGIALSEFGPIHHAWVVDRAGNAIDPTWERPAARYYGATLTPTASAVGAASLTALEVAALALRAEPSSVH